MKDITILSLYVSAEWNSLQIIEYGKKDPLILVPRCACPQHTCVTVAAQMEAHASSRRCPQLPVEIWKEMKHCSEARTLDIFLRNTACKGLADVMTAGSHHKRVQRLAIFFDFEHKNGRPGFDEKDLPWLATFLRRATQLEDLVLDAVTIDVIMLMMLKA